MRGYNILINLAITLSVEDRISTIEKNYLETHSRLSNMSQSLHYGSFHKYSEIEYVNETIKRILAFQTQIELLYEESKELSDEKTKFYIDRSLDNLGRIRRKIRGYYAGNTYYDGILDHIDDEEYDRVSNMFKGLRRNMYAFMQDVKTVYAIRVYPIEEKIALKSQLSDYGFVEVVKCLDEAEDNLAMRKPEHYKDCIDRSREALEKTAAGILNAENKKPSGYFSTDMGTLSGLGIVDKETKRLTEASYSFLSEVGAHGRAGEVTLGDAHYAMKETYMRIDILLKKYAAYLAGKKKN